jgi:hypothetical protein
MYYPGTCREGLKKPTKNNSQHSRYPVQDSNRSLSEYESRTLPLDQTVRCHAQDANNTIYLCHCGIFFLHATSRTRILMYKLCLLIMWLIYLFICLFPPLFLSFICFMSACCCFFFRRLFNDALSIETI